MAETDVEWPEWLTPEYSALHQAIVNDMVRALNQCYSSADAAGMEWTEGGWLSCSASSILRRVRDAGCPPTFGETEVLRPEDVHSEWGVTDDTWDRGEEPDDTPLSADDLVTLAGFARAEAEGHDGAMERFWSRLASRAVAAAERAEKAA